MVAAATISRFRAGNLEIVDMFTQDLGKVWGTLDLRAPGKSRDLLLGVIPELSDAYGEISSVSAADWFDDLRSLEGVPGFYYAEMAETVPREVVEARVKYGARHLWTPNQDLLLPFLQNAISEYILQPGRDTIVNASLNDPFAVGWARETRPSDSYHSGCGFCQMLAGRGGVYRKPTASFAAHGTCQCVAVPSWDPSAPEVPVEAYEASKSTSKMSAAEKERHNESIRAYVNEHHPVEKIV